MGKTLYNPQKVMDAVVDGMSKGIPITTVLKKKGMPSAMQFYRWVKKSPELQDQLNYGYELRGHYLADKIIKVAKGSGDNSKEAVARNRLEFDAHRWTAARMFPKKYGDKMDVTSGDEKLTGVTFKVVEKEKE